MQHKDLASGRWSQLSLLEKLGNIGSEVERTIKWKEKGKEKFEQKAFLRSLELFDLTLSSGLTGPQLREVARAREMWVDFAYFDNEYRSTAEQWRSYFNHFIIAYRNQQKR